MLADGCAVEWCMRGGLEGMLCRVYSIEMLWEECGLMWCSSLCVVVSWMVSGCDCPLIRSSVDARGILSECEILFLK